MKFLFFFSLFMIFYVYLGYPMVITLVGLVLNRKVKKAPIQPSVTIVIAAYNEEGDIEKTIRNKLDLDYPKDKLEIVVISDGSTDRTEEIVRRYEDEQVRLIRQEPRAGKTSALNMAVPQSKGEIIAFSDANSMWAKNALAKLVSNFAHPTVGYVTGKMIYTNPDGSPIGDGCTAYIKYENFLRRVETRLGSVVGVDGGVDAVRKELYRPMNSDQLPDFVLPLMVIEQGFRVVYEPASILMEPSLKATEDEYRMRVRVSLRSLWAIWDMRRLLTSSPSALFAWQLWSHKILRYFCFLFLIAAYFSNLVLWKEGDFYKFSFFFQNMGYLGGIFSPLLERRGIRLSVLYMLKYFLLLNAAAAHAFLKFARGEKMAVWTPRKGI